MDYTKACININASIIDVMKRIDELVSIQTVFIVDNTNVLLGTITDGDIRRGFIEGLTTQSPIEEFLHRDFCYLEEGYVDFSKISKFRKQKLKAVPLLSKAGVILKVYDFTETKAILPIDAVIMAGGKGERLLPLTKNTPKPLLKIGNKEIISYNFDRLYRYGIENQHVTVNYLADSIKSYCDKYIKDIKFDIIKEESFLGTAGALSLIKDFANETILLMNSDLLTNIDYEDFYREFVESNADIMVASIPYEVNLPYAIFDLKEDNVVSFKEKPKYTHYANAGLYLIKKEVLDIIPLREFYNATDLMEDIISQGKVLKHYPLRCYWLDIGKHNDFEKAQKDIAHIDFD
jgi:dTDP-glucose pyrophosphorylase